jgi:hypothetical protein
MTSNVRSLAPIDLRGSLIFGQNLSAFPLNPLNGQMELVNGALWVYAAIDGISTWYPLTNKKNSYVHTQGVDSFQWTVYHGLNTPDVLFGVYDTDGSLQYPTYTPLDNNSFRLNFTSAVSGRCVVFADSERFAPNLSTNALLAASIDISNGTVTAGPGGLAVNGNNVATLGSDGKVPAAQLPSYVDDVLEFANLAGFPASGSSGIIYVTQDANKTYRWSGSAYVEIFASPGSTDSVPEGTVNKYYTAARAQADVTSVTGNAGTATKLATARTLGLSGDASGSAGFDGSANATITVTLANSGVTAGSYAKVTVDAKGRVTAGATLAATDIPSLDWSKLTSGKPTTLAGYGITDAAPLASPALSGVPTAPTAAVNTNTTQIATTAFVVAQIAANGGAGAAIDGGTF